VCSNTAIFVVYLILPTVSTVIFTSLPDSCHRFSNGDAYLRADYSMGCHYSGSKYAYIALLAYPIFLPSLFAVLLIYNRDAIRRRSPHVHRHRQHQHRRQRFSDTAALRGRGRVHRLRNHASMLDRIRRVSIFMFRQLWSSYTPECWWFEMFEFARRIFLTGGWAVRVTVSVHLQHRPVAV
jgi:hypothetical protein